MKAQIFAVAALALVGFACAQSFTSVQEAVDQLPELSMLQKNVNGIPLADQLRDTAFVGTLFAPTNAALKPLEDAVGGDFTSLIGDPQQIDEVFSTSVVPGAVLELSDLKDGQELTTLKGEKVKVKVVQSAGGPVYYVNQARLSGGNIKAGKAVIHEVAGLVVPEAYQDMLNTIVPPEDGAAAEATQDLSALSLAAATTETAADAAADAAAADAGEAVDLAVSEELPADSIIAEAGSNSTTKAAAATPAPAPAKANSAGGAAMGAALLAVPALLAALL